MASKRIAHSPAPERFDQPTFFQYRERKGRSETRSNSLNDSRLSSDSSHPSPKTTVAPRRRRKPRRTLADRSLSAPAGTIPELAVPTISNLRARRLSQIVKPSDEGSTGRLVRRSGVEDTYPEKQASLIRAQATSNDSSISSLSRHLRNRLRTSLPDCRLQERQISSSTNEQFPRGDERAAFDWFQTSLRDGWNDRLKTFNAITQRRAKSAELPARPIVPLRPPASRKLSGSRRPHTVRLETSFAKLAPDAPQENPPSPPVLPRLSMAARTKTVFAKRVRFSSQRGSPASRLLRKKPPPITPKSSFISARNRTNEGLQRVASILYSMVGEVPSRPTSCRSSDSCEPLPPNQFQTLHRKRTSHLPAVVRNRRCGGKFPNLAYTSCQKMSQGATPLNTPDPNETYRVKRSPSAETEEFFKIDISIRGGTSYLPSEAKRVHTPPLPTNRPGHRRMGFFFDYTPPMAPRKSNAVADTSSTGNTSRIPSSLWIMPPGLPGTIPPCADWFDTKLAEIDAFDAFDAFDVADPRDGTAADADEDSSRLSKLAPQPRASPPRSVYAGPDNEVGVLVDSNVRMDLNVPEHLPSSPLCPRYGWGAKVGAGHVKRACWMHGMDR